MLLAGQARGQKLQLPDVGSCSGAEGANGRSTSYAGESGQTLCPSGVS